jgi:hypothetical protein
MSTPGALGRSGALDALEAWLRSGVPPRPRDAREACLLVDAAVSQGLVGLLCGALEPALWPEETRERIHSMRRALLFRGVQQLAALAWASDLLAREGLRSLPLKGGALAEDLYDSVADRPMCDVDLLALDDFGVSRRVLERAGLRAIDVSDHAVALAGDRGLILELHSSVASCPDLFPGQGEALWARSREGGGQVRRLPSPEDLLVQLGLHAAFQHGLVLTLVQYLDFRRLLQRPLDAERAARIAAEMGAEIALAAALQAATARVAAPVPEPLYRALAPACRPRDVRWISRWLSDPERAIAPRSAPLLRLRWMTARGRRRALLRGTFLGRGEGLGRRVLTLATRHGGPALRQLLRVRTGDTCPRS